MNRAALDFEKQMKRALDAMDKDKFIDKIANFLGEGKEVYDLAGQ